MTEEKEVLEDRGILRTDHDILISIYTRLGDFIRTQNHMRSEIANLTLLKQDKKECEKTCDLFEKTIEKHRERIVKLERYAFIVIGALLILEIILRI